MGKRDTAASGPRTRALPAPEIWAGSAENYAERLAANLRPVDVCLTPDSSGGETFAALLLSNPAGESGESHGLSPVDHLRRCTDFAGQGLQPLALSVLARDADGQKIAVSVWSASAGPATKPVVGPGSPPVGPGSPPVARALRFIGRQSVVLEDSIGLTDVNRRFTVEMRFRLATSSPPGSSCLMGNAAFQGNVPEVRDAGVAGWLLMVTGPADSSTRNGQLVVRWGGTKGQTAEATATIPAPGVEWHHVAFGSEPASDGGWQFTVFFDGALVLRDQRPASEVFPESTWAVHRQPGPSANEVATLGDVRGFPGFLQPALLG